MAFKVGSTTADIEQLAGGKLLQCLTPTLHPKEQIATDQIRVGNRYLSQFFTRGLIADVVEVEASVNVSEPQRRDR